jgi:hypothetical protein
MTKVADVIIGERIQDEFVDDRQEVMKRSYWAERTSIRGAAQAPRRS